MINKLINMEVKMQPKPTLDNLVNAKPTDYTVEEYASAFLSGLSETQRNRFKKMVQNNYRCALNVVHMYGVDYDKFLTAVKQQLNIKEEK